MEAVIFMGIQAVGKSEFYKRHFFKTHIRINLDMLKTRNREKILFQACLEAKQPFVIDNTNPTKEDRKRYIEQAQIAGFQIVGYYFQSQINDAIERNHKREGKEHVPEPAILGTYNKLELPIIEEGFDQLYYVKIDQNNQFIVEDYNDEV